MISSENIVAKLSDVEDPMVLKALFNNILSWNTQNYSNTIIPQEMKVSDKLLISYTLILFEFQFKNKKDRALLSKENVLKSSKADLLWVFCKEEHRNG